MSTRTRSSVLSRRRVLAGTAASALSAGAIALKSGLLDPEITAVATRFRDDHKHRNDALKKSNVIWTAQNLDRWLANPEALVPGQGMGFRVEDAMDRADLIAYLSTLSDRPARP